MSLGTPLRSLKEKRKRSSKRPMRRVTRGKKRKVGRCQDCPPTYDQQIFDKLVSWRKDVSTADKVPAFVVFTDATLVAIAEKMPTDLQQLRQLPGIGPKKLERYGADVLAILGS